MIGEILLSGGGRVPRGYLPCDGRELAIASYREIYGVIGQNFGGQGDLFALPDLRGRMTCGVGPGLDLGSQGGSEKIALNIFELPAHRHPMKIGRNGGENPSFGHLTEEWISPAGGGAQLANLAVFPAGGGAAHDNMPPFLGVSYLIKVRDDRTDDPYVGDMRLWAGSRPPEYWIVCDGKELKVRDYQALFAVIGNAFNANPDNPDWQNFRAPNLQARFARGAENRGEVGAKGGASTVKLEVSHLPSHGHALAEAVSGAAVPPAGQYPAGGKARFAQSGNGPSLDVSEDAGGGLAHDNMPPYLALNYILCTQGNFPVFEG